MIAIKHFLLTAMILLTGNCLLAQSFIDPATGDVSPSITVPGAYQLDFSDEFNDNTIDAAKWNIDHSTKSRAGRPKLSINDWWWVSDNAYEQNGSQVLDVDKYDFNTMHCGSINSKDKYERTFGYFEVRIKIAEANKGTHTAFWLQGQNMGNIDGTGQDGAEIDVFESAWLDDYTKCVVHIDGYASSHQANTKKYDTPNMHDGNFHTWGFLWEANKMSIYYDGTLSATYTDMKWIPQVDEYLWLSDGASFGIEGDYFTSLDNGYLTSAYVDYIRVWTPIKSLDWTGTEDSDFFNEQNWVYTGTEESPDADAINPSASIDFDLVIKDAALDIVGDGMMNLPSERSISLDGATLKLDGITSGKIELKNAATVIFNVAAPLGNDATLDLSDSKSWVKFLEVDPNAVESTLLNKIKSNAQMLTVGTSVRINQYYYKGSLVRLIDSNYRPLSLYADENLEGTTLSLSDLIIHKGSGLGSLNNAMTSFKLDRGYMATMAIDEDGSGKSAVYIASEKDLQINLSANLDNQVSFIRVIPWNWVTKKGGAGFTEDINTSWTYNWGNSAQSLPNLEYAPMAWGGGAATEAAVAEHVLKQDVTHMLGFNESDNCDDQSGQYGNLCQIDVAVPLFENLMGTGLRLVSPSPRENGPFGWLSDFNDLAVENDVRMDVIGVHWYDWGSSPSSSPYADAKDVFNRFKTYLTNVHKKYQKPIWITEFNANPNRDSSVQIAFIKMAIPYLESLDYVERYCYFEPNKNVSIANGVNPTAYYDDNGDLTSFGTVYKNFESTSSRPEDSYFVEGTIAASSNDGGGTTEPEPLYWTEYHLDGSGNKVASDLLPYIEKADERNVSTADDKWVLTTSLNEARIDTISAHSTPPAYPAIGAGSAFRLGPETGAGANIYKNVVYDRRLGNPTSGDQDIYVSFTMTINQTSNTAEAVTFPFGFSEITNNDSDPSAMTRALSHRLLVKTTSANTNSTEGTFQLGIQKTGGTQVFDQVEYGLGTDPVFVVMKLSIKESVDDILQLYVSNTVPSSEPTQWTAEVSDGTDALVNTIFLREKMDFNGARNTFSEIYGIRTAGNWSSLIPTTFWNNSTWSLGTPSDENDAVVESNLTLNNNLTANNLIVKTGAILTVNAGVTIDVKGSLTVDGDLIIESGGSLLVYKGQELDAVMVRRNSSFVDADKQYSFIGSPVAHFNIADLGAGYHYTYNTVNDTYSSFSGVMTEGVGYTSAGKQELIFHGTPNTGTIKVPLDNSGEQFNFVSNPYTAAINYSAFVSGNSHITGAIYIWDDGGSNEGQRGQADFITVSNAGSVGGSGGSGASFNNHIGGAQGFLIQASSAGDVVFNENMRVAGQNSDYNYFRKNQLASFKLQVGNEKNKDETLIVFTDQASEGFDRLWDASKFPVNNGLQVSSLLADGTNLAIQTLPVFSQLPEMIEIHLSVSVDEPRELSFEISESTLSEDYSVLLIDKAQDMAFDISASAQTLTVNVQDNHRFALRVISAQGILGIAMVRGTKIYVDEEDFLNVNINSKGVHAKLAIYNLGGQLVENTRVEMNASGQIKHKLHVLPAGIYIVKIEHQSRIYSGKFIR